MSAGNTSSVTFALMHFLSWWLRLMRRVGPVAEWKPDPITLWCQKCSTGYASVGEVPQFCPECNEYPNWSTRKPYRPSLMDKRFLRSIKIDPEN